MNESTTQQLAQNNSSADRHAPVTDRRANQTSSYELPPIQGFTTQQMAAGIHLLGAVSGFVLWIDLWLGIPLLIMLGSGIGVGHGEKNDSISIVKKNYLAMENFLTPFRLLSLGSVVAMWLVGTILEQVSAAQNSLNPPLGLGSDTMVDVVAKSYRVLAIFGWIQVLLWVIPAVICVIQAKRALNQQEPAYPFSRLRLFERILRSIGLGNI